VRSTFFLPLSSPHMRLASQPPGSPPSFVSASSCPTVDVVRFLDAPVVHARLVVHRARSSDSAARRGQPSVVAGVARVARRRGRPACTACSLRGPWRAARAASAARGQPSVAAGVPRLRGPDSASSRARLAIRRRRKVRIPRLPLR
jgi:hypothetical protein